MLHDLLTLTACNCDKNTDLLPALCLSVCLSVLCYLSSSSLVNPVLFSQVMSTKCCNIYQAMPKSYFLDFCFSVWQGCDFNESLRVGHIF